MTGSSARNCRSHPARRDVARAEPAARSIGSPRDADDTRPAHTGMLRGTPPRLLAGLAAVSAFLAGVRRTSVNIFDRPNPGRILQFSRGFLRVARDHRRRRNSWNAGPIARTP